jgi:hypothetical protein
LDEHILQELERPEDKKKSEVDYEDDAVEPKIQAANKTQVEVQEEKVLDEQKCAKVIGIYANWRAASIQKLLRLLKGLSKEGKSCSTMRTLRSLDEELLKRNLQLLKKLGIMMIQGHKRNGVKASIKNLKRWKRRRFGKS